jgi:hypothetical protein
MNVRSYLFCNLNTAACLAAVYVFGSLATAVAEPPPLPPIVELTAFPAKLELSGIRDSRRILVSGKTADGQMVDLTLEAKLAPQGDAISVDDDGYVSPRKEGTAQLTVQAAGKEIAVAVEVKDAKPTPVSFVREIQPSMSKVGCNAGTCHGAQEGKNGFKLSLFGKDSGEHIVEIFLLRSIGLEPTCMSIAPESRIKKATFTAASEN